MFDRLCPKDKHGKRSFAPVMLRRLKKLGIEKTDPSELTPEEQVGDMAHLCRMRSGFADSEVTPESKNKCFKRVRRRACAGAVCPAGL